MQRLDLSKDLWLLSKDSEGKPITRKLFGNDVTLVQQVYDNTKVKSDNETYNMNSWCRNKIKILHNEHDAILLERAHGMFYDMKLILNVYKNNIDISKLNPTIKDIIVALAIEAGNSNIAVEDEPGIRSHELSYYDLTISYLPITGDICIRYGHELLLHLVFNKSNHRCYLASPSKIDFLSYYAEGDIHQMVKDFMRWLQEQHTGKKIETNKDYGVSVKSKDSSLFSAIKSMMGVN